MGFLPSHRQEDLMSQEFAQGMNVDSPDDAMQLISDWLSAKDESVVTRALAQRPDLIEGLTRALGAAKKRQAEALAVEKAAEEAGEAVAAGGIQDAAIWNKLKKLVESPFNEQNRKVFDELADQGIDWFWAPEKAPTIMLAALNYLARKDRVAIDWPVHVIGRSKAVNAAEWAALHELMAARGAYSLDSSKLGVFLQAVLCGKVEWADMEKETGCSALSLAMDLLDNHHCERRFLATRLAAQNGASFQSFKEDIDRRAAKAKIQNLPYEFWQRAMTARCEPADQEDRVALVATLIGLKEVKSGWASKPAGIVEKAPSALHSVGPARAYLTLCCAQNVVKDWAHHASIFDALCKTEDRELALPRLDRWGMTRLRWANEIATAQMPEHKGEVTALMAVALKHGDEPQSIAGADPVAWAKTDAAKKLIASALERQELAQITRFSSMDEKTDASAEGAASARRSTRATNRL